MALLAPGAFSRGKEAPTTIFRLPSRRKPEMVSLALAAVPGRIAGSTVIADGLALQVELPPVRRPQTFAACHAEGHEPSQRGEALAGPRLPRRIRASRRRPVRPYNLPLDLEALAP